MNVTVVGAGVFGAWTAKFLADASHQVTLVDAYGPANGRASSSDHSRVLRSGYGADEVYARWASESREDWQWLSEASGHRLFAEIGALFLGEPGSAYVRATYDTLTGLGLAADLLDPDEVGARYPQFDTAGLGAALLEPQAGVIRARAAVQALVQHLVRHRSVKYLVARVDALDEQRPLLEMHAHETALRADAYVLACGPWLPALLPQSVGARIRATRQEVLYFGVPAGQTLFAASQLPVWIDFEAGYYGVPDLDAQGFKIGVDRHGPPIDPDQLDRIVDGAVVEQVRAWMGQRFPGMRGAPLVEARVCQYENTSSGDFLIDRHPAWSDCWIVGGGSGHGFKHGPAVGRHAAALVSGAARPLARFSLASKATAAARAVY